VNSEKTLGQQERPLFRQTGCVDLLGRCAGLNVESLWGTETVELKQQEQMK
jgi:hypothetical protein